jgi:hypothetical protein
LVCRAFGFLCAPALSANVSSLIALPSPFGGSFERNVAVLYRGSVQRIVLGKVPELPTFPTLIQQFGVENSLGCCVFGSGPFNHGWYPYDPGQFAYVLDFHCDHRPRRSLDVRIRGFYVENLSNATSHDGQRLLCAELDVEVRELHLYGVCEKHLSSMLVGSEKG